MKSWIPIIGAGATAIVVNLVGVLLFFKPIAQNDQEVLTVHPALGLLVYVIFGVWLFEWTARQIGSAYKAAFVVASSQFILILELMMRGERGPITVLARGILLAVTWLSIAFIYSKLRHMKGITDAA